LWPPGRPTAPQGPPPTHQHPMGGGWGATASSGVSGARVVAAQRPWRGRGGLTPPREPAPMRSYHPLLVVVPYRHMPYTGVKKGHARVIYFLLQTRNFWHTSAPPLLSLRAAIYSPVPFIGCIGSSYILHWASIWSFCRSKEFALVYSMYRALGWGRLPGYMRIVHRVTRGKIFRFCT
jgi:hypothetical protein